MNPERAIAYRKQVSGLLEAVLNEEISARVGLNAWPQFCNEDPSVQAAYTMLWYFESDEDRRQQELMYSDLQLQLLRETCDYLKLGESLPQNILLAYQNQVAPSEYKDQWTWQAFWWRYKNSFSQVITILRNSPWLNKKK